MNESIEDLQRHFREELSKVASLEEGKPVRDKWVGRENGIIAAQMKRLRELPKEERPAFGQAVNRLRSLVEAELEELERSPEDGRALTCKTGRRTKCV